MSCWYCHNEGNTKSTSMLTEDDVFHIIRQSRDIGIKELRLTGGEPLLNPYIIEICRTIKNEGLRVSLNTNLVAYSRLKSLLCEKLIDEIVVGLDLFNGKVSKDSPIGLPSSQILQRIIDVRASLPEVSISSVYNGDTNNLEGLFSFCVKEGCRLKVLEPQYSPNSSNEYSSDFNLLIDYFTSHHYLVFKQDERDEVNGFMNDRKVISFFPSLCRLHRCDICKKTQLRINSEGYVKPCIYDSNLDFSIYDVHFLDKIRAL